MLSDRCKNVKPSSTLQITAKAKEYKDAGVDIVAFTAGEPDFNTPDYIKEAAIEAINSNFTRYTKASGIDTLREEISNKLKKENNAIYSKDEIIVSNGGKHCLINVFMAILNNNDEVIIPSPFWLSYPEMVKIAGGRPVFVNTENTNYKVTKKSLEKAYTNKTRAIIINSPSNPTGVVYTKSELETISEFAIEKNIIVISDEIYEYLIYDGEKHISIASLPNMNERTIIVNGFSKAYSMTGWRLGYLAAPLEIAKGISALQSHMTSNPSSISQKAGEAALLGDIEIISNSVKAFDERRKYIYENIKSINGLNPITPKGAFYLFIRCDDILGKYSGDIELKNASDVAKALLENYNTVVIPCGDFGSPNGIRLSYAVSMEDIEKGVNRIKKFVEELK